MWGAIWKWIWDHRWRVRNLCHLSTGGLTGWEEFKAGGKLCTLWSAKFLIFFVRKNHIGLVLQDFHQDGILPWFLQLDERGPIGKTEKMVVRFKANFKPIPFWIALYFLFSLFGRPSSFMFCWVHVLINIKQADLPPARKTQAISHIKREHWSSGAGARAPPWGSLTWYRSGWREGRRRDTRRASSQPVVMCMIRKLWLPGLGCVRITGGVY